MNQEIDPIVLLRQLDRACRFGFLVVTGLFAYFSIRLALAIGHFEMIFRDMLGNKPLPMLTEFIISANLLLVLISFGLPILAIIIAIKVSRADKAVLGISLCSFGLFLITMIMWSGLMKPLFVIVTALTS